MRTGFWSVLILGMIVVSAPVHAAPGIYAGIDKYFKACAHEKSERETSTCLGKQYASVDAQVKTAWREVLAKIESNTKLQDSVRGQWKHNFRESQDFWVRYKEAECRGSVPYQYGQGSLATVKSLECFLRVTVMRLAELKTYLSPR